MDFRSSSTPNKQTSAGAGTHIMIYRSCCTQTCVCVCACDHLHAHAQVKGTVFCREYCWLASEQACQAFIMQKAKNTSEVHPHTHTHTVSGILLILRSELTEKTWANDERFIGSIQTRVVRYKKMYRYDIRILQISVAHMGSNECDMKCISRYTMIH